MKKLVALLMAGMLCLAGCASGAASSSLDSTVAESSAGAAAQDAAVAGTWVAHVEDNGEAFTFTLDLSDDGIWSMAQDGAEAAGESLGGGTYTVQDGTVDFMNPAGKQEFSLKLSADGTTLYERSETESGAFVKQ